MRARAWLVRALVAGAVALALLASVGFATGWLAITQRQRPVGRLRPADLVLPSDPDRTEVPAASSSSLPVPATFDTSVDGTSPVTTSPAGGPATVVTVPSVPSVPSVSSVSSIASTRVTRTSAPPTVTTEDRSGRKDHRNDHDSDD